MYSLFPALAFPTFKLQLKQEKKKNLIASLLLDNQALDSGYK